MIANVIDLRAESATRTTLAIWIDVGGAQPGLGYAGEWFDAEVEAQYLRVRWYDVATGRFTSQDPWEGDYERPQSLNGWVYVEGNPVRLVDPSGYTWDEETKINVQILKEYFLKSAARHNAIPTMDQNGFAGLIAATIANENRMGNIPQNDPLRNRWGQAIEDNLIHFGCITSGHYISDVCDPRNEDTFDIEQCLAYLNNQLPEGKPLFTLASVGIGNIKFATAARLWRGLNGCDGAECPPVTVSPLQYDLMDMVGFDFTLDINNPFSASCEEGACDYDPDTNTTAYQALGAQLLDPRKNIEYAAALLEEGALMTLNAGEQPTAFASIMWYKHSAATHEDIRDRGRYADLGYILEDVNQALDVWGLSTIWDYHSWDMEPHYHQWLMWKAWEEQYGP